MYLQQVSNTVNALNSNLGTRARKRNDLVITPRLDYQASSRDGLFLSFNVNRFNSPGGVITDPNDRKLWDANPGQRLCAYLPGQSGMDAHVFLRDC